MSTKNQQIISIIGRPNVGKSTLFNRLIGKRQAIESAEAGTTRDRLYGDVTWCGKVFTLVDTAGFLGEIEGKLSSEVREGIEIALEQSDQVIFVVDAKEGLVQKDFEVAKILRKKKTPTHLVINKSDGKFDQINENDYKRLGFDNITKVSAISGQGSGDMLDMVCDNIKDIKDEEEEEERINLAIIGKPNVGKSTLLNKLVGEKKMIVSEVPGTTRDSQNHQIKHKGQIINLIDTAGLRRPGKIKKDTIESFSKLRSLSAIKESNVVLYMADASEGFGALDANLVLEAKNQGKSIIIVINKLDIFGDVKEDKMAEIISDLQGKLNYMPYLPVVFISALEGDNLKDLLSQVIRIYKERHLVCEQEVVDKILEEAKERHSQIAYIQKLTFLKSNPPVFKIKSYKDKKMHFSHARYLENKIRDVYPFDGTPIFIDLEQG